MDVVYLQTTEGKAQALEGARKREGRDGCYKPLHTSEEITVFLLETQHENNNIARTLPNF